MCKVIAVTNQKGGVGKTTTTVNLGIGLAKLGKKVLLIDSDPQGSLTISLGYREPDELDITLADLVTEVVEEKEISFSEAILHHTEGIDFIPANIELSALEVNLVNVISREYMLKCLIDKVRDNYDVIIIDCMPSLGMLTINALVAADSVLIPVQAGFLSVKGLEQLIKTIGRIQKRINKGLVIEGILLTMVDSRTNYAKDVAKLVYDSYSGIVPVFETTIPMSVRAAEVSAEGSSIYEYDPKGKAAAAYKALTEEVANNG